MSCIDAAIIKKLVEHIGMNPDDVHTGGSNSGIDWSSLTAGDYFEVKTNSNKNLIIKYIGEPEMEAVAKNPVIGKLVKTDGTIDKILFFPPTSKNKAFISVSLTSGNNVNILNAPIEKSDEGYVLNMNFNDYDFSKSVLSNDSPLSSINVDGFVIQTYLMYLYTVVNPQE